MLRYELVDEPDSVRVTFMRSVGVGEAFAALIFVVLSSWTWTHLRTILYSTSGDVLYGDLFLFEFGGLASVLAGAVLVAMILRTQAIFSASGILLRKTFFGISVKSAWFAEYEICRFGSIHLSHTTTYALGLSASGSMKFLCGGASFQEVNSFLNVLRNKRIEYSAAAEPRHSVSSANSFLRQ